MAANQGIKAFIEVQEKKQKRKTVDRINTSGIMPEAKAILKECRISVKVDGNTTGGKPTYTKRQFLNVFPGFDCLENLMMAKMYVKREYGTDARILDILLHYYPKQYFTKGDLVHTPRPFSFREPNLFVKVGLMDCVVGGYHGSSVYTLSALGKSIVRNFYKVLSGEKKLPEDYFTIKGALSKNRDDGYNIIIKKLNKAVEDGDKKQWYKD